MWAVQTRSLGIIAPGKNHIHPVYARKDIVHLVIPKRPGIEIDLFLIFRLVEIRHAEKAAVLFRICSRTGLGRRIPVLRQIPVSAVLFLKNNVIIYQESRRDNHSNRVIRLLLCRKHVPFCRNDLSGVLFRFTVRACKCGRNQLKKHHHCQKNTDCFLYLFHNDLQNMYHISP